MIIFAFYKKKEKMNKRNILPYEDSKRVLAPYYGSLAKAISESFADFQNALNLISQSVGFLNSEKRTKACMMHDFIQKRITEIFCEFENTKTNKYNGVFALMINEELFIRFNKLNENYCASGYPTKQSKGYLEQRIIEGFPDKPTFLIAGYIPDKSWSKLLGVYLVCREGETIHWVENILNHSSTVQTILPFEASEQKIVEKRVKVKNQNQSQFKTGTNN